MKTRLPGVAWVAFTIATIGGWFQYFAAPSQVFPLIAGVSLTPAFKDLGKAWEIVKPLLAPDAKKEVNKMLRVN